VISAFYRGIEQAALKQEARVVLIDVGPNPDAINRATILSAQYVVVPLAPDLFSLQGLQNPEPTLRYWREEWSERITKKEETGQQAFPISVLGWNLSDISSCNMPRVVIDLCRPTGVGWHVSLKSTENPFLSNSVKIHSSSMKIPSVYIR